jgi:MFS family permease
VTPDLARADRAEAVRRAACSWRRAGVIDDATLAAVAARYADDRVRVGPVFRVLLFLFTLIAGNAAFGMVSVLLSSAAAGKNFDRFVAILALLAGGAFAVLAEVQIGKLRRRQGGTEAATSLLAVGFLLGAVAWWVLWPSTLDLRRLLPALCLAAAVLAAAAWRWGYPLYAGAATATLLLLLAGLPLGRLWWIVLPLAVAPLLLKLAASPRLPPAHRGSWTAVLLVSLAGLYAAVHIGSWEEQLVEEVGHLHFVPSPPQDDALWWLSVAATALVPVVLLACGIRGRRYPLLLLGAGTAVASLVTLRWYVHLAPLWVVLTLSGVVLATVVLVLRRYLESGPEGERHGFTAASLFQDLARQRLLEAGAAMVTLTPAARNLHDEPKFEGGGGQFGGGGASGEF